MVEAARPLLRLGDERAAERDVQLLEAAADGEEGHAALERQRNEAEDGVVAGEIVGLVALGGGDAVALRVHVGARAGEEHAVDAVEHGVEVERGAEARQQEGRAADAGDRLQVGVGGGVPGVAVHRPHFGGDEDQRAHANSCTVGVEPASAGFSLAGVRGTALLRRGGCVPGTSRGVANWFARQA